MQTQADTALKAPKITDAELQRQEDIFRAAARVKQLREDIKRYDTSRRTYRRILEEQLEAATAAYQKITSDAVAQAVRS